MHNPRQDLIAGCSPCLVPKISSYLVFRRRKLAPTSLEAPPTWQHNIQPDLHIPISYLYILCARILCDGCLVRNASAARKRENAKIRKVGARALCAEKTRKRENSKSRKSKNVRKKHEKSKIRKSEYTSCLCLMPQAAFKRMPFALVLCTRWPRWPKGRRQVLHHREIMLNSR